MVRFLLELTLPVCLLLLQLLWSYVYPHLSDELNFRAEPPPKEASATDSSDSPSDPSGPKVPKEVVFTEKSVIWLTPSGENKEVAGSGPGSGQAERSELPLFPLGASFYALNSHPTLQIFEPRYRQLYHDILASGKKSFVVTAADPETARLAAYGVIFHVDSVTDVGEQTGGEIKYIAEHTVKSRVQIHRVLNLEDAADGRTYLTVSAAPVEDDEDSGDEDLHDMEAEVADMFTSIVGDNLDSEILSRGLQVNASRGGLWQLAALWLDSYARHRVQAIRHQLHSQVKEVYEQYANEHTQENESVDAEVRELKAVFDAEMRHLLGEQVSLGQLILQSRSHKERLHLLRSAFQVERLFAAAADPESMAAAFVG